MNAVHLSIEEIHRRLDSVERTLACLTAPQITRSEATAQFREAVAKVNAAHPCCNAKQIAGELPLEFKRKSIRAVQWHLTG